MMGGVRATVAVSYLTKAPLTGTGVTAYSVNNLSDVKTFQAIATTTAGAGAATVVIEGTVDGTHYDTVCTLNCVASTTGGSDSLPSNDRYDKYRVNVTGISGTGCGVVVVMGS